MKSLSDNLEKNQPLDLDLPTDFDFTHKHYQIMTLVTAGVTTLIIIFFIYKMVKFCKGRYDKRTYSKSRKVQTEGTDSRHEITYF